MIKTYLFILILLPVSLMASTLSGHITHGEDASPIAFAIVKLLEIEQWTTTDEQGYFHFQDLTKKKLTIEVQYLGMQDFKQEYILNSITNIEIHLSPSSFSMEEITVTAQQGKGLSTSSFIQSTALEHVQPTSLSDVMQLVAGNLIDNPDLSTKQTISIREIGTEANSAIGTAIIIDGSPISNLANLQTYSTVNNNANTDNLSTAGGGLDLRQISTDNIASVEVIKGIPSVEYGNLTSGAVIVKTKAGYTPLEVKIKSDPKIKQMYVGKGLKLNKGGAVNTSIDYTSSLKDLRTKYTGYDRLTAQLAYSRTFFTNSSPLSFNTKLALHQTLAEEKTDPDALLPEEVLRSSVKGARLNIHGRWALNKNFISNLEYTISATAQKQEDYERSYGSSSIEKISLSRTEGSNIGMYLPSDRLTELTIDGRPTSIFTHIKATKQFNLKHGISNHIKVGSDYSYEKNNGKGRIYDIMNPPVVSNTSSRPRTFNDIPASKTLAVYIEDKVTLPIANTRLDIQGGIRFNNFQATGLLSSDVGIYAEPRLNIRYKLIDNTSSFIKKLTLHSGIGLNYMNAPLLYLYPDLTYIDMVELDHYTEDPNTALVRFNTFIFDSINDKLKPSRNYKREIGFDITLGKVEASFTGYRESLSNGYSMTKQYAFLNYTTYDDSKYEGALPPLSELPTEEASYIIGYNTPINNKGTEKYGLEYDFNFGKIEALKTKVIMHGAWMKTRRINNSQNYNALPPSTTGTQLEYVAVYPSGESSEKERLNTNFTFISHSTRLRLIFTTTIQVTWYDKSQQMPYDESPLYLYGEDGVKIPFTQSMRENIVYRDYVKDKGIYYFDAEIMPPLVLCNFKLSKEFSNKLKLSFYANNFLNHRPTYQYERSQSLVRRNPSIYFGAELKINI